MSRWKTICLLPLLLAPAAGAFDGDLFTNSPALLLNRQGWAQTDLSTRAGTYSGTGLTLNGLELRVPWSAHFNAETPLPSSVFAPPELQTGGRNLSDFSDAALALRLRIPEPPHRISAEAGAKNRYAGSVQAFQDGFGGFVDGESARDIDLDGNDLDRYRGGILAGRMAGDWRIDATAGGQKKRFGANGYYGRPDDLEAEETTEDALFAASALRGDLDDRYFRATALWRQFDDTYESRKRPDLDYDTRSRHAALLLEGRTLEVQNIALLARLSLEHESLSGSEGRDGRDRANLLILPEWRLRALTLRAGWHTVVESSRSVELLPRLELELPAGDNASLYASYTEHLAAPDFQTLLALPGLEPAKTRQAETGWRRTLSPEADLFAGLFYRHRQNGTDWINGTAVALDTTETFGAETGFNFYPSPRLNLKLFYQWAAQHSSRKTGLYAGDYPEHLLTFSGHWTPLPRWLLSAVQTLRYQAANELRSGPRFGADASLRLQYTLPINHTPRLYLDLRNLWGSDFEEIPGVPPPSRSCSLGLALSW